MKTILYAAAAATGLLAAPALAQDLRGTGYTILNGTSLVRIDDLMNPAGVTVLPITGDVSRLDAIAYRPNTRGYFGYDDATDSIYEIDVATGATTFVVAGDTGAMRPEGTSTTNSSMDFNNAADAARFVSVNDENGVFFPDDSTATSPAGLSPDITRVTDLFYVDGDDNVTVDPNVIGNAYYGALPQALAGANNGGKQLAIDSGTDALLTLGNNAGTLTTLGKFTLGGIELAFGDFGGLDILSPMPGTDIGIALLEVGAIQGLYRFDAPAIGMDGDPVAGNVAVTFLGALPGGSGYSGLAVAPSPIPLPATALLLFGGLGALGAVRRRKS